MPFSASLKGAAEVRRRLERFKKNLPEEVGAALYKETEIEAKEVKRRTPVDRGNLRASVHVKGPFIYRSGKNVRIFTRIAVGGPSAPYAIYVHEDLDAFHKVGQAKFLESVVLESRPYMAARVAKRLRERLDRMVK